MNHTSLKNLLSYTEAYPLKPDHTYYLILDGMGRVKVSSQDSTFQIREYIPPVTSETLYSVLVEFFSQEVSKYQEMIDILYTRKNRKPENIILDKLTEAENNLALVKQYQDDDLEDLILEYPD